MRRPNDRLRIELPRADAQSASQMHARAHNATEGGGLRHGRAPFSAAACSWLYMSGRMGANERGPAFQRGRASPAQAPPPRASARALSRRAPPFSRRVCCTITSAEARAAEAGGASPRGYAGASVAMPITWGSAKAGPKIWADGVRLEDERSRGGVGSVVPAPALAAEPFLEVRTVRAPGRADGGPRPPKAAWWLTPAQEQ